MISAEEARKQSEQNNQNKLHKEIEMIEQKIINAIVQGQDSVCIGLAISVGAKQMLEQLGYKVECGQQYNESFTDIEW